MIEVGELTLFDLKKLISFIHGHYNFDFKGYALSSFKRRVTRILHLYSIVTIDELIRQLDGSKDFFDEFLREITVNTTEMFRAPSFWRKLRDEILPTLAHLDQIKIWSAACSSGEEVYSLAIVLQEANLLNKTKILATDINNEVLLKGSNGTYWARNLEVNENNYLRFEGKKKLSDYYTKSENNIVFGKDLIQNVTFKVFDLVQQKQFSKFDLILCRNVMIYFNPELQNTVVDMFCRSLFMNGFFVVGEKETIAFCKSSEKFSTFSAEERIYQKTNE